MLTTNEVSRVFRNRSGAAAGAALLLVCLSGCASANPDGTDLAATGAAIDGVDGSSDASPAAAPCSPDGLLALIEWTDESWAAFGSLMQSAPNNPAIADILFFTPLDWGLLSQDSRDAIASTKEAVDITPEPSSTDGSADSGLGCLATTGLEECEFFDD